MLKRLIPNINGVGKAMRSATPKNLDSVFNSLLLLVNTIAATWQPRLATAMYIAYSRVQGLLLLDPASTITQLKVMHKTYLEYIRGGPEPILLNSPSTEGLPESFVTPAKATVLESLVNLRKLLHGNERNDLTHFDTLVLAFLSIHRVIVLPPVLDYSTITGKPTIDTSAILSYWTEKRIGTTLARLGINRDEFKRVLLSKCAAQEHIIMSTAGPNGKASWSAFSDAKAWLYRPDLLPQYINWAEGLGMTRFVRDLIRTVRIPSTDAPEATQLHLGRLHSFEEWGGKTRHVAIVDYWTQLVLTPLHDTLFSYLGLLETDATFDQDAASETIKGWTLNPASELNSFDLTAATDRLPLTLQVNVLAYLLGSDSLAANWAKILVGREYFTTDAQFIQYATGAPMGSKSNWAMLALVHHMIVQDAADASGYVNFFSGYRICGDDVVINGTDVSINYRKIMSALGLAINDFKSILHGIDLLPAAEFCKRIFVNGVEYTAIPVKLVAKTVMNGRLAPQLQSEVLRRGFNLQGIKLFTWLSGLIDSKSIVSLGLLNVIPTILSGLYGTISVPTQVLPIEKWFEGRSSPITERHVIQAYTYTLVVEQLQRLDNLLRQTEAIANAIRHVSAGYSTIDLNNMGWSKEFMESRVGLALLKIQGELDIFHPVVQAAKAEYTRVANLLAAITNGDNDINTVARARMLDEFRNSLVSVFDSDRSAVAQADRTLLEKSLDNLDRIINNTKDNGKLQFTTMLEYLQRLWVVSWTLDGNVEINAVNSKVSPVTSSATERMTAAFKDFSVSGRFAAKKPVRLAVTPQVTETIAESPSISTQPGTYSVLGPKNPR